MIVFPASGDLILCSNSPGRYIHLLLRVALGEFAPPTNKTRFDSGDALDLGRGQGRGRGGGGGEGVGEGGGGGEVFVKIDGVEVYRDSEKSLV
jgi:hypothetical protein